MARRLISTWAVVGALTPAGVPLAQSREMVRRAPSPTATRSGPRTSTERTRGRSRSWTCPLEEARGEGSPEGNPQLRVSLRSGGNPSAAEGPLPTQTAVSPADVAGFKTPDRRPGCCAVAQGCVPGALGTQARNSTERQEKRSGGAGNRTLRNRGSKRTHSTLNGRKRTRSRGLRRRLRPFTSLGRTFAAASVYQVYQTGTRARHRWRSRRTSRTRGHRRGESSRPHSLQSECPPHDLVCSQA